MEVLPSLPATPHIVVYRLTAFTLLTTWNFQSFHTTGKHFDISFTTRSDCPIPYEFRDGQCRIPIPIYSVSTGVQAAVYATVAVDLIFIFICFAFFFKNRTTVLVRASSSTFMFLILFLLSMFSVGALTYAWVPGTTGYDEAAICQIRAWLTCIPIAGLLGVVTYIHTSHTHTYIDQRSTTKPISVSIYMLHVATYSGLSLTTTIVSVFYFDLLVFYVSRYI